MLRGDETGTGCVLVPERERKRSVILLASVPSFLCLRERGASLFRSRGAGDVLFLIGAEIDPGSAPVRGEARAVTPRGSITKPSVPSPERRVGTEKRKTRRESERRRRGHVDRKLQRKS